MSEPHRPDPDPPLARADPAPAAGEGAERERPPERVLVCVGTAPGSARVIRAAQRIAAGLDAPWIAAAVEASSRPPLSEEDRERLEAHLRLAESLGAEVIRLPGVHVAETVLELARRRSVSRIVLGKPGHARWRDRVRRSLVDEIVRGSGAIEVAVLSGADERAGPPAAAPREPAPRREYLNALGIVGITTVAAALVRATLDAPDVEMLFLLAVLVVALTSHRRASIFAAVLAVVSYDFFFVPPPYTLNVSDARYFLTFAMMLVVGIVIGTLTLRLREQQRAAVVREQRTSTLYALSRELGAAMDAGGVGAACARAVSGAFGCEVVFLGAKGPGALAPIARAPGGAALTAPELAAARWALQHGRAAGRGTETLAGAAALCVPLRTFGEPLAVLAVKAPAERRLTGDQRELLDALGRQAAVALDRVRLAEEARRASVRAKTEELRSSLLSSVSHDLRTPLAAITGAGTLLLEDGGADPALRRELTITVVEEAERLERLVSNLLDMTRLESGVVEPRREWVPLVEVVGSAMNRVEQALAGRPVTIEIPDGTPLLSIDAILVEQLFVNLLENAAKYTPPGAELRVRATQEGGSIAVEVADRGPGIPAGEEERVFERFHRAGAAGVRGAGLGLPIARAIAHAHGGRLTAANRSGGGAVFRLTLPILEPPPASPAGAEPPSRDGEVKP